MATRRTTSTRHGRSAKPMTMSAEKLAEQLSSGLTISNQKGKRKASTALSHEDVRLAAMRSVNSASQALSAIVQSGWKRSSDTSSSKQTLKSVTTSMAVVNGGLADLRHISPNDVDVERAAVSVLGKLVALEMFDEATFMLEDSHPRLCSLHNSSILPSSSRTRLHLLSISFPSPGDQPLDPILLGLTSTYLAYALSVLSATYFTTPKAVSSSIDGFSTALETGSTLLTWLPLLSSLPSKQMDSTLTRVYTALTRSCAISTTNPQAVFITRLYALRCLAHTTPGTIEPSHFWDQITRFGGAFIKTQILPEREATRYVLSSYGDMVNRVEKRIDREIFMSGKSFVRFSEYWMAFAQKAGNISVLDRIGGLMQKAPLPSSSSHGATSLATALVDKSSEQNSIKEEKYQVPTTESTANEVYRICAFLAQITIVLEQDGQDLVQRANEITSLLVNSHSFIETLNVHCVSEDDTRRINDKLDRALERTRQAALVFLESPRCVLTDDSGKAVQRLIEEVLQIWRLTTSSTPNPDTITRSLETLFVLARITLAPIDPRSYTIAHKYLTQAVTIVETPALEGLTDAANLIRCISGAFHNLAGTLYQAGRHGAAIGFLQDACSLGSKALNMPRITAINKASEKAEEGWRQLEEQLYRRWELLGVCYSKIGDRKQAFEALRQCVTSFPYAKFGFSEQTNEYTLTALFDASSGTKQLGTLIDRLSYLAACELLMDPSSVSLASSTFLKPDITGALLERQVESLEPHRRREGVQGIISQLLSDTLNIYTQDMPVRRARVLLKCMGFAYYAGLEALSEIDPPDRIGSEIEQLTNCELGKDVRLGQFRSQYQASAHLWLALHAHRRVDIEQSALIKFHSDAACKILKSVVGASGREPARKSSPKQVVPSKKTLGPPLFRPRSMRMDVSQKRIAVTPKPKARKELHLFSPKTPPRSADPVNMIVPLDDFQGLLSLIQLTTRIAGILALTISKVHMLDIIRKLCDKQMGILSDGYIVASVDLACEYVKLGKVRRAAAIFNQVLVPVRSGKVSDEACVLFFLRFAESLALEENADNSISIYCEALTHSANVEVEDKAMSTTQRIHIRVKHLERAAIASRVYSLIQYVKEDISTHLDGMLQSLRLWNRAVDTLARLNPSPTSPSNSATESNPFQVTSAVRSPEDPSKENFSPNKMFKCWPSMGVLEWRISEGLLETLFSLSQVYLSRGSPREAEYFAQQAQNLAESLNAPAMVSRALAKRGEVQLYQGLLDRSFETLTKASESLQNSFSFDSADTCRLRGVYSERTSQHTSARELYQETMDIIKTLDQAFNTFDGLAFGPERMDIKSTKDIVLPELLAVVLRQNIWLLRDNDSEDYTPFLNRFLSLPHSIRTKTEENTLMAKLTLYAVYRRLHSDMFLSSLTESTIALPMGMSSKLEHIASPPVHDILATLDKAGRLFWTNLLLVAQRGSVLEVRETVMSLALVQAFQTSLGKVGNTSPRLVAGLLDASAAITLRRDMLATIQHKFPAPARDDLDWPLLEVNGVQPLKPRMQTPSVLSDNELDPDEASLNEYWNSIRTRYLKHTLDISSLSTSQMIGLPLNWTIINISVTEDKSMLFVTRQEGGENLREPLIFCIPLKGRRDNGSGEDEEENLTFDDALEEFHNIVRLSDKGTKAAAYIKDDQEARATWWKQRGELNTRMRELLENIEFCWLGAFKTILSPRPHLTPELISDLRSQFEKVFQRILHMKDNKTKPRHEKHKKSSSQIQNQAPKQVTFDDSLLECFSTLSPKCRDEELEDLVYFILDLYQFHGIPVAIAEVDVVQVVVDLRGVLEDHALRLSWREPHSHEGQLMGEEHTFLVLDKNVQCLPWESIPILRGRSISRIPSIDFLHDRLSLAKWKGQSTGQHDRLADRAVIDPRKGYYILNPSGDLHRTEGRFKAWAAEMEEMGWGGISGHPPSEQQFLNALQNQDLVVYFGHGGGEQYIRSHKIRSLPSCAATMLWGCSSGILRDMGDFDPMGTPYNYMLAGCPTLVANLWDVTDRDIDIFSQSVFNKLHLTASGMRKWADGQHKGRVSVVEAVAQSRDSCKLEYLTGAAPVVYGIPFYL